MKKFRKILKWEFKEMMEKINKIRLKKYNI